MSDPVFLRKQLFKRQNQTEPAEIILLVIAHRIHFLNWAAKNSFENTRAILVRDESDMHGFDPATTFVLPLFLNSKYSREKYQDLFSSACERFRVVDVNCA